MPFIFNPFTGTIDAISAPAGSNGQVQFNDGGAFGGFGSWDGNELTIKTIGDGDTNPLSLRWLVHEGGANEAEFSIVVAGDSGNNTPDTTFTVPGLWKLTSGSIDLQFFNDGAAILLVTDTGSTGNSANLIGGLFAGVGCNTLTQGWFFGMDTNSSEDFVFTNTTLDSNFLSVVAADNATTWDVPLFTVNAPIILGSFAFASLPTASTGMIATVTDSNTATWGATIAGGGANNVLARYNGANWTVIGI